MAFSTSLIAFKWESGKLSIVSQMEALIDDRKLMSGEKLANIKLVIGYLDYLCILSKEEITDYFHPQGWYTFNDPYKWLEEIKGETTFFLIHVFEWESGME